MGLLDTRCLSVHVLPTLYNCPDLSPSTFPVFIVCRTTLGRPHREKVPHCSLPSVKATKEYKNINKKFFP